MLAGKIDNMYCSNTSEISLPLCHLLIATCIIGMKNKTFYTFWFEKNQTPMSMFILALNDQSSIQNCHLILYDCCSSKGKSNKTYC